MKENEKQKDSERCPYNERVDCEERTRVCKKCGWNPEVDKKRRQELRNSEE